MTGDDHTGPRLTRAQLLRGAAAGAGLAALGGGAYGIGRLVSGGSDPVAKGVRVRTFHSRPDLQPQLVEILHPAEDVGRGRIFLAPSSGAGQRGPMIVDDAGEVIWFRPTDPHTVMDFRPGMWKGKHVLTWWEANDGGGLGNGEHVIVDTSYRELARFPAGNGLPSDLHELWLTKEGTALVTAFEVRPMDLSAYGGPKHGHVMGGVAQELDVPSARVLLNWASLDHVPVAESYTPAGYPWDYFHINAIDVDYDGHLLISGRNTWAVYKVHRHTGEVIWRLGGKRTDFALGKGARFAFQHDARRHGDSGTSVSVFDNGGAERRQVESQSRGLFLTLDHRAKTATVAREYTHSPPIFGRQMGNVQVLPNGNVFVGWGTDPHTTEFAEDGTVVFDATLPYGGENYRAFRFPWTGTPADAPVVVQQRDRLWASWNGATEVYAWRVDAGPSPSRLRPDETRPRLGFETPLAIPRGAGYAVAVALNRDGETLGQSHALQLV